MQWDDEFAAKRRVVLDSYFLEHLARDADVAQVDSASPLSQGEGEAKREGPLGLNCQPLSASWGVQAEHRGSVLVRPVCSCAVPGLIHQEGVLMAVQAVNDQVNGGVWQICEGEERSWKSSTHTTSAALRWNCSAKHSHL